MEIKQMSGIAVEYLFGAPCVGEFESNSPEWLELRKQGIGGSDVAAVVGVSKWTSAYALWAKKSGLIPDDFGDSEAMEWGRILEPVIQQKFADKHPEWQVINSKATFASAEHPWMLANVDGFIDFGGNEWGILEIKTAAYQDDWVNGVPLYYQTQVRHYLRVFGLKRAVVAVLFHGNAYKEYDVFADEFIDAADFDMLQQFWNGVQNGLAPAWEGSTSTYEAVRSMHPDIDPAEVDLGDLGLHLVNAAWAYDDAEKVFKELKSRTLDAMGSARYGYVETAEGKNRVAARQSKNGGFPYLVVKK